MYVLCMRPLCCGGQRCISWEESTRKCAIDRNLSHSLRPRIKYQLVYTWLAQCDTVQPENSVTLHRRGKHIHVTNGTAITLLRIYMREGECVSTQRPGHRCWQQFYSDLQKTSNNPTVRQPLGGETKRPFRERDAIEGASCWFDEFMTRMNLKSVTLGERQPWKATFFVMYVPVRDWQNCRDNNQLRNAWGLGRGGTAKGYEDIGGGWKSSVLIVAIVKKNHTPLSNSSNCIFQSDEFHCKL